MRLTSNHVLKKGKKPYFIAEIGSNHNGDMGLARKLVLAAKESGADCVKFQSWTKDTIFSRKKYEDNYFIADDYRDRDDCTLESIVEKYSISEHELLQIKKYADEIGIDFTSTPFSEREADFLVNELCTPFIKVASMDLNNLPFLEYLAKKNKPLVISVGLSELYEIDRAVKLVESLGNKNIVILHCVSTYPPNDNDVNLNNIKTLESVYPDYFVGFSDHTIGVEIPLAAAALGACIIEKHFTLNKNMEGWDHAVSADKSELNSIITGIERINNALGSFRLSAPETDEKKLEFRRSIVIRKPMKKGDIISIENLDFKRPGIGFEPSMVDFIVGLKINKNLNSDHILTKSDLI